TKQNVIDTAITILDDQGLPGLTMRRLATALGLQQSALYWHFESKQLLLAAMAEEILSRGPEPTPDGGWDSALTAEASALRDSLLAYRDGAELVSTVYAFGLGANEPHRRLAAAVASTGASAAEAEVAATVILQFVLGFTFSEQQHLQASSAGAIEGTPLPDDSTSRPTAADPFRAGIALILDGIRARLPGWLPH
ncbi:MAG TPA: TetR/AcrR family transcriptional regulator C-terminal domain-containing protein, partial [Nocardioidaceae bacterium]|nr:TetR/AcrR family transcriptional regulator C-terminal domain-containing protein [Nocardioidaceae bacterium]